MVNQWLTITPSVDQLARIIGSVAAPAFLLGALAAFIAVLISRLNRVVDRSHFLHGIADDDPARSYLKQDLPRLQRRAMLLNQALFASVASSVLTSMIVIVAFASAMLHFAHEYGIAVLFTSAQVLFCWSLINLARETRIALHDNDLRA